MDQKRESSLAPLLIPAAVAIAVAGVVLRWCVSGGQAATGVDFFIHALILTAALGWLAHGVVRGTWTLRAAGPVVPLALFAVLSIVSILRASYKLPALEHSFAFIAIAVLYVLVLNLFATRRHLLLTMILGFTALVCCYAILQRYYILPKLRETAEAAALAGRGQEFHARLMGNEVWGTFFYPNSLAGFLALVLPIVAGLFVDLREKRARICAGAVGVLALFALYLTGSKGGWVAAAAGLGLFSLLAVVKKRAIVWSAVGAAAAIVLALAIAGPLSPSKVGGASMRFRSVYWGSALKITQQSPVLGVGLDNYQDYYTEFKGETQQETRKAHNDYLQILAEMGVVGLLALLGFVAWTISHGVRAPRSEPVGLDVGKGERWILGISGIVAIALARIFTGIFGDELGVMLVVGGAWVLVTAFAHQGVTEAAPMERVRLGAIAGFVAMALHMTVDFDLYDFGLPAAWVIAAALVSILGGRVPAVTADRAPAALGAFLLVTLLVPALWYLPKFLEADATMRDAAAKVDEAGRLEAVAAQQDQAAHELHSKVKVLQDANDMDAAQWVLKDARSRAAQAEEYRVRSAALYADALRMYEEAEKLNFLDSDAYYRHAELCEILWDRMKSDDRKRDELQVYETVAILALEKATQVRPRFTPGWIKLGTLYWRFADYYKHTGRPGDDGKWKPLVWPAVDHFRKAVQLYPTDAHIRYRLARVLELGEQVADARVEYAEALRLSDLAAPERLDRLQLAPEQKARCLLGLGRDDEAKAIYRALFRKEIKSVNHIEFLLGQNGAKLAETFGYEYDDVSKPVIDGILQEMRR